jgi:hypothetical protein
MRSSRLKRKNENRLNRFKRKRATIRIFALEGLTSKINCTCLLQLTILDDFYAVTLMFAIIYFNNLK